ncbi:MAG: hypothetical protein LC115_05405 [Bacteroidia bacterium]|nr:hypothetical protein [Bacteroidia bacterium]
MLQNPPLRQAAKRYKQPIGHCEHDGQEQPSTKKAHARNRTFRHISIFTTTTGNGT